MTTIDLSNRTAFVTGSTRGIGRAIAGALYGAGAKVAIIGRDAAKAQAVAAELGERAKGFSCDVTQGSQIESAIAEAEKALGPIDILVNNAGITKDNLMLRMSEQDFTDVLQANLTGAFTSTKTVLKGMMKRRWGRIINITSVVGISGNKGQANYAASKAGLIGFTKSVAKEYGSRGILVNAIAPGFVETDMTAGLPAEAQAAMLGGISLGRLGQPGEIAGAVLFLASDLAGYITGQVLVVDGGLAI